MRLQIWRPWIKYTCIIDVVYDDYIQGSSKAQTRDTREKGICRRVEPTNYAIKL